jgi:2-iminoacetate synthase ThiH
LADESPEEQLRRLGQLDEQMKVGLPVDSVAPTPSEDTLGIATLTLVARCRLFLPQVGHVMVDLERLGPKLGQLCLGFGADELFGPIVSERPLRLGEHAGDRNITRHEAAQLLRGAGMRAFERVSQGQPQEFVP